MSAATNLKDSEGSWDRRSTVTVIVSTVAPNLLHDLEILQFPFGLIIAYTIALLVGYWIAPRPPYKYSQFALGVALYMLGALAGLWGIPKLLTQLVPVPLAYGLPTFVVVLVAYWAKPLYPVKQSQNRFWVWLLFSAGIAGLYGWAMSGS